MSKAILGAAALGVGIGVLTVFSGGSLTAMLAVLGSTGGWLGPLTTALIIGGASMEAGAIAQSLASGRGMNTTTRQPASFRQIVRGEQRIGGVIIYRNTTGSHHDQYNYVIVLATHVIDSIVNLYLDGRQVHWQVGGTGNTTRNGVNFGGSADHNTYIGPNGAHYNFGTLVYCEARFGDQPKDDVIGGLTANDPNWACSASGCPWVGGCAYVYLKVEYDTAMFPGEPEVRFTVRGKNDILDPRTGIRGFTHNWALNVADHISDPVYGVNDANINQAQLIAAANVCDEQVALASGQTENRYSLHMHYDTGSSPGDILQQMMPPAVGRISRIGPEWFIWPAYWQGPSFAFDQSVLIAPPQWNPVRSFRDLCNRVTGTYTAPNYPYNTAGNLYDGNGWYDGSIADQFPYAFQPTSYPMYAVDPLHGYAADEYLDEDGGVPLPQDLTLNNCLSIAQAQRCAKIHLLRNRQQGMAQFTMNLSCWQMQPVDVMQFNFPALSWASKQFEIDSLELKFAPSPHQQDESSDDQTPGIYIVVTAIETDPSVYQWSTVEELTAYDVPAKLTGSPLIVPVPPNVTITSSAATAIVGADGVVTPRVQVQWGDPLDKLVTQIQIEYQLSGSSTWLGSSTGLVAVDRFQAFVIGVVAGQVYNFRVRCVRSTGAVSDWVEEDGLTISITLSTFANTGVQNVAPPGVLSSQSLSAGTAEIIVWTFTATYGSLTANCVPGGLTAGQFVIPGLTPSTLYWVYYQDPTFAGGNITPYATQNTSDFQNKVGYWLIGSITTAADGSGAGIGRYEPSTYTTSGTATTGNPTAAYDNNTSTCAVVQSGIGRPPSPLRGAADCIWRGFPNIQTTVNMTLYIDCSSASNIQNINCFIAAQQLVVAGAFARQTFTVPVPSGTSLINVYVEAAGNYATTASDAGNVNIYEIYIQ